MFPQAQEGGGHLLSVCCLLSSSYVEFGLPKNVSRLSATSTSAMTMANPPMSPVGPASPRNNSASPRGPASPRSTPGWKAPPPSGAPVLTIYERMAQGKAELEELLESCIDTAKALSVENTMFLAIHQEVVAIMDNIMEHVPKNEIEDDVRSASQDVMELRRYIADLKQSIRLCQKQIEMDENAYQDLFRKYNSKDKVIGEIRGTLYKEVCLLKEQLASKMKAVGDAEPYDLFRNIAEVEMQTEKQAEGHGQTVENLKRSFKYERNTIEEYYKKIIREKDKELLIKQREFRHVLQDLTGENAKSMEALIEDRTNLMVENEGLKEKLNSEIEGEVFRRVKAATERLQMEMAAEIGRLHSAARPPSHHESLSGSSARALRDLLAVSEMKQQEDSPSEDVTPEPTSESASKGEGSGDASQVAELQSLVDELRREQALLEEQFTLKVEEHHITEQTMQQQVEMMQEQVTQLTKDSQTAAELYNAGFKESKELQETLAEVSAQLEMKNQIIQSMSSGGGDGEDSTKDRLMVLMQQECDQLNAKIAQKNNEAHANQTVMDQMSQIIGEQQAALEALKAEFGAKSEESERLVKYVEELRVAIVEADAKLEEAHGVADAEVARLKEEREVLVAESEAVKDQLAQLRKTHDAAHAKYASVMTEVILAKERAEGQAQAQQAEVEEMAQERAKLSRQNTMQSLALGKLRQQLQEAQDSRTQIIDAQASEKQDLVNELHVTAHELSMAQSHVETQLQLLTADAGAGPDARASPPEMVERGLSPFPEPANRFFLTTVPEPDPPTVRAPTPRSPTPPPVHPPRAHTASPHEASPDEARPGGARTPPPGTAGRGLCSACGGALAAPAIRLHNGVKYVKQGHLLRQGVGSLEWFAGLQGRGAPAQALGLAEAGAPEAAEMYYSKADLLDAMADTPETPDRQVWTGVQLADPLQNGVVIQLCQTNMKLLLVGHAPNSGKHFEIPRGGEGGGFPTKAFAPVGTSGYTQWIEFRNT